MRKVYLLSKTLDPILGTFTGLLAYCLSETNPRSNIQQGHTLQELIPWQWGVWKAERQRVQGVQGSGLSGMDRAVGAGAGVTGASGGTVKDGAEDVDWEKLRRELE